MNYYPLSIFAGSCLRPRVRQVERCYKTFCIADSDRLGMVMSDLSDVRSGWIEEPEFRQCVALLWSCDVFMPQSQKKTVSSELREDIPATRFRQFWLEARRRKNVEQEGPLILVSLPAKEALRVRLIKPAWESCPSRLLGLLALRLAARSS